jgi:hypothetical protein
MKYSFSESPVIIDVHDFEKLVIQLSEETDYHISLSEKPHDPCLSFRKPHEPKYNSLLLAETHLRTIPIAELTRTPTPNTMSLVPLRSSDPKLREILMAFVMNPSGR